MFDGVVSFGDCFQLSHFPLALVELILLVLKRVHGFHAGLEASQRAAGFDRSTYL